jgi:hypothetical protein
LTARSDPCDGAKTLSGFGWFGEKKVFFHVVAIPLGSDWWWFIQDALALACREVGDDLAAGLSAKTGDLLLTEK